MGLCYSTNIAYELEFGNQLNEKVTQQLRRVSFSKKDISKIKNNKEILRKYNIQYLLGSGLFSQVFLAQKVSTGEMVALKIVNKKSFYSQLVLKKFLIEKLILQNLDHRNLLKMHGSFQSKNKLYYEIEYAEFGNVLDILN